MLVVVVTLLFCGAAALQFKKVYFDYNLLHMQSRGLPMVSYEKKLLFSGQSLLSAAIVADSLQEAREIETKRLRNCPWWPAWIMTTGAIPFLIY